MVERDMDPLSHGVLGASVSQSIARNKVHLFYATLFGLLGGMAPDLDIFIRSSSDPLLFLEFHRQFTHSLIFIPLGGLICALVFYAFTKKWISFRYTYLYATLGYSTHCLLDSCTTYGTQLFWPFSNERVAWNNVSIIDPLFTVPIFVLVVVAFVKKKSIWARIALCYALIYLCLGVVQWKRALNIGEYLAHQRGLEIQSIDAKPSFANLLVWKIIAETSDRYYVDAVRVGFKSKIYEGENILKLNMSRDLPWLDPQSLQGRDLERFRWFSMGAIALHPDDSQTVIDARYSMIPNEIQPLWGIQLDPLNQNSHVDFINFRKISLSQRHLLIKMILGD